MAKAEYPEKKEHPKMPSGFQCFVCGKQPYKRRKDPTSSKRITR